MNRALAEVDSSALPGLEKKKGGPDNWVEKRGVKQSAKYGGGKGLPDYIEGIARHLQADGHSTSSSIAMAISTVKKWCSSGHNHNGSHIKPETVTKACDAVAQWEAMKGKSKMQEARAIAATLRSGAHATPDEVNRMAGRCANKLALAEGILLTLDDPQRAGHGVEAAQDLMEGRAATLRIGRKAADAAAIEEAREALEREASFCRWIVDLTEHQVGAAKARQRREIQEGRKPSVRSAAAAHRAAERTRLYEGAEALEEMTGSEGPTTASPGATKAAAPKTRSGGKPGEKKKDKNKNKGQGSSDFEGQHPRGRGGLWIKKGDGMGAEQPSPTVQHLQNRLHQLGYGSGAPDGKFGPVTEQAVRSFQQDYGLDPTGVVDAATIEVLRNPVAPQQKDGAGSVPTPANANGTQGDTGQFGGGAPEQSAGREAQQYANEHPKATGQGKTTSGGSKGGTGTQARNQNTAAQNAADPSNVNASDPQSVVAFQKAHGLEPDGIVGPATQAVMRAYAQGQQAGSGSGSSRSGSGTGSGSGSGTSSTSGSTSSGSGSGSGTGSQAATITQGENGPRVQKVQRALADLGYDLGDAGVDGKFGPDTLAAIKKLQEKHGLKVDGVVGPATAKLLKRLAKRHKAAAKAETPKGPTHKLKASAYDEFEPLTVWTLEEGLLSRAIHFDPAKHPRNRQGEFAKILSGLHVGQTAKVGSGVRVKREKDGFKVDGGGAFHEKTAEAAAARAMADPGTPPVAGRALAADDFKGWATEQLRDQLRGSGGHKYSQHVNEWYDKVVTGAMSADDAKAAVKRVKKTLAMQQADANGDSPMSSDPKTCGKCGHGKDKHNAAGKCADCAKGKLSEALDEAVSLRQAAAAVGDSRAFARARAREEFLRAQIEETSFGFPPGSMFRELLHPRDRNGRWKDAPGNADSRFAKGDRVAVQAPPVYSDPAPGLVPPAAHVSAPRTASVEYVGPYRAMVRYDRGGSAVVPLAHLTPIKNVSLVPGIAAPARRDATSRDNDGKDTKIVTPEGEIESFRQQVLADPRGGMGRAQRLQALWPDRVPGLREAADLIEGDWERIPGSLKPYVDGLRGVRDPERARPLIRGFLAGAQGWTGATATSVKATLAEALSEDR